MSPSVYDYGPVAFCYDEVAAFYSLGRIERSKRVFLDDVVAGDRVLIAGAGRGSDALAAARAGARVVAVDRSPQMIARLRARAKREALVIECVEADITQPPDAGTYDHVVAHYFLNCFAEAEAAWMLDVLARYVAPSGRLHLADFAPATGGPIARAVTGLYYGIVNRAGWALGLCAIHPIPDWREALRRRGFEVERVERLPLGPGPGPAYWSVTGRARSDSADPPSLAQAFP